ncbi:hypothetical protein SAMN05216417_10637 [Nitrosospira multiformis]|uniref:Uncharacterized protein n=1 Tax=Nitrosospira multiformis TaxID=1231 RepID=A0A1I7GWG6_9PROT|nr:hypothetical protein SAMN05216417_10637 [Nitrosospira multiformis]
MMFDRKDWERRMEEARTGDELAALIMELPDREWHELSEEEQESVLMDEKIEAEFYPARQE